MSVLAQCAIDNAKRTFDIDLTDEIRRIKNDMDINEHRYPEFWRIIKKDFNKDNINKDLICPMNYLASLKFDKVRSCEHTIPMSEFFIKHPVTIHKRKCMRIENMIERFSISLSIVQMNGEWDRESVFLLRSDFSEIVREIQTLNISSNYLGLMSWLIDRAFQITPSVIRNRKSLNSKLSKNKSILLKILYESNKNTFLSCFIKK